MTVRDFIERHPEATLDLMTPDGYVYLTPEQARALLQGKSVTGHPGDIEMGMEVTAKELLSQRICSVNFSKGAWHMLTDDSHNVSEQDKEVEQTMDKEAKLRERVKANYDAYIRQLQTKPAPDLIEMASEIAAAKFVYEELMVDGYFADSVDYLLEFEHPLELVRDAWLNGQNYDRHEELDSLIWNMADKGIGVCGHSPAPEEPRPALEQGVTMC